MGATDILKSKRISKTETGIVSPDEVSDNPQRSIELSDEEVKQGQCCEEPDYTIKGKLDGNIFQIEEIVHEHEDASIEKSSPKEKYVKLNVTPYPG
jgi:hypothetical protein